MTNTTEQTSGDSISLTGSTRIGTTRHRRLRTIAVIVGVPILVIVVAFVGLRLLRPHIYAGTVMQAPTAAPSLDGLYLSDGSPVDLADYRGDVVVLFFGYTACPDVCPTTLARADLALGQMGGDADRVHVLMVSVDPERDDAEQVGEYVRSFDPSFLGATGSPDDVARVATTYGIFFARGDDIEGGGYTVDHTATLIGIDTDGHMRIVWPNEVDPDALAGDLRALL